MKYEILSSNSEQGIKALVARHMYEGWKLHGGLSVIVKDSIIKFYQSIVKE